MVDLCCDAELEPFYRRLGLRVWDRGMGIRNYAAQAGRAAQSDRAAAGGGGPSPGSRAVPGSPSSGNAAEPDESAGLPRVGGG
jgi:hypothetical protein